MASRALTSIALAAILYVGVAGVISLHAAQDATTPPTSLDNALPPNATGADIFRLACSTCHAIDGSGSPQSLVGLAHAYRHPSADGGRRRQETTV